MSFATGPMLRVSTGIPQGNEDGEQHHQRPIRRGLMRPRDSRCCGDRVTIPAASRLRRSKTPMAPTSKRSQPKCYAEGVRVGKAWPTESVAVPRATGRPVAVTASARTGSPTCDRHRPHRRPGGGRLLFPTRISHTGTCTPAPRHRRQFPLSSCVSLAMETDFGNYCWDTAGARHLDP